MVRVICDRNVSVNGKVSQTQKAEMKVAKLKMLNFFLTMARTDRIKKQYIKRTGLGRK